MTPTQASFYRSSKVVFLFLLQRKCAILRLSPCRIYQFHQPRHWNALCYGIRNFISSSPVLLEGLLPAASSLITVDNVQLRILRCISGYVLLASEKGTRTTTNFLLNDYRVLGWPEARISSISLTSTKVFKRPAVAWLDNFNASSSVNAVFFFCPISNNDPAWEDYHKISKLSAVKYFNKEYVLRQFETVRE